MGKRIIYQPNATMLVIKQTSNYDHLWDLLLLADPSRSIIEEYITQSHIFVATQEEEVCGVCVLKKIDSQIYEIMNLAVLPTHQGQGIGGQLLSYIKHYLAGSGPVVLYIATGNTSLHQIRLYEKAGFVKKDVIAGYFTRKYPEPIFENGLLCTDLIILGQLIE